MSVSVIIPFRDRGIDPLRSANLTRVMKHWYGVAPGLTDLEVIALGDGRAGNEQFNRSASYNRGAAATSAEILIFAEADMLISFAQIRDATVLAASAPGLVMPFTEYHALSPEFSQRVRNGELDPTQASLSDGNRRTAQVHGGAINVVSRETYVLAGGFDEGFAGNWYDDDAAKIAFEVCAGPTRFVAGPAYHLYHLPGHAGNHLTGDDVAATAHNRARLARYRRARTPEQIHALRT